MSMWRPSLAVLLSLLAPHAAFAAFSFSEIMYDPSGTDSKREWVEVLNSGPAVDIASFKLFEGGVNHGLSIHSGSPVIPTGGYVIIADDAAVFLAEYPTFSGSVFDSAFSLSNTGETLVLRNGGADVATATYTSATGAQNDGMSLAFVGGAWVPRTPSPGAGPEAVVSEESAQSQGDGGAGGVAVQSLVVRVSASPGSVVGAPSAYTAQAFGLKGEPLEGVRYVWNFGNGATREGQTVVFAYTLPGTFDASVDVSNAGLAGSARFTVVARVAEVVISRANASFIELDNRSPQEVDVSLWRLVAGDTVFVLPPRTTVRARATLAFPHEVTGMSPLSPLDIEVQYPNGARAAQSAPEVVYPILDTGSPRAIGEQSRAVTRGGVRASEPEPRVLAAASTSDPTTPLTSFFFGMLGAVVVCACAGLAYIQFKK